MNKVLFAALCALTVSGTTTVFAYDRPYGGGGYERGDRHENIGERMRESEERIRRGIDRGAIDRQEAHRLHQELQGIRERMERMRYDDRAMSREEGRAHIDRDLDRLNEDIGRAMHDEDRPRDDGRHYGWDRRY